MAQSESPHGARRATMEDVAALAGVSITTVSRMLSGLRPVSKATSSRIENAIRELDFRPNATARALRTQRSHDIALVLGNISHEANPLVARGAGEVVRAAGYNLVIYETDYDAQLSTTVMESIRDRGADGSILLLPGSRREEFEMLAASGVAIVYAGPGNDSWGSEESVQIDEAAGIALAAEHLLARVDGIVAYIGGPTGDPNAVVRREAFIAAMRAANRPLDIRHLLESPWSYLGGADAVNALLADGSRIAGLVCANDLIAIGAIQALRSHGLTVPGDVAVTGFDNIEASALVDPPLTTVEPYELRLGQSAARSILRRLGQPSGEDFPRTVTPTLVVRGSAP